MSAETPPTIESAADAMRRFGLELPDAWEDFPWGERALKVKKKVFAFLGGGDGETLRFSLKLPESGADVLSMPFAKPTGYNLGRAGWVSFTFTAEQIPDVADLEGWLEESFRAVAPKTQIKALDARGAGKDAPAG